MIYIVCVCILRMAPEVVVCETDKDNPYDSKVLHALYRKEKSE